MGPREKEVKEVHGGQEGDLRNLRAGEFSIASLTHANTRDPPRASETSRKVLRQAEIPRSVPWKSRRVLGTFWFSREHDSLDCPHR